MNALDEWCRFLAVPATYMVSVCLFMSIRIIVPCYKLILSNCAERVWYLPVTLTHLGIVWSPTRDFLQNGGHTLSLVTILWPIYVNF